MNLEPTFIDGLYVAHCKPFVDNRGAFFRCFCDQELQPAIGTRTIKQINHSRTESVGAVRGMHFQYSPVAEMKMVRCLRGMVWDVAIDLRRRSATFLKWFAQELTPENCRMMIIPEGFAHGFQVLAPGSELLYLHTASYSKHHEGAVRFDDPAIGLEWPLPITDVSDRDKSHALIDETFTGIEICQ